MENTKVESNALKDHLNERLFNEMMKEMWVTLSFSLLVLLTVS